MGLAMNLRTIDLNLLPVLEAIYAERSLTRASESLHITQPAVSNALARLGLGSTYVQSAESDAKKVM